jgi:predicted DNA binding CopG/RHH family protein
VSGRLPFKRLASELIAHGVQSEYLARVEARITREQKLETLQAELTQEIAAALGRTDTRVNLAFAELELCRARYDKAQREGADASTLSELAQAFNAQRDEARARLRDLQIQREAIGFRRNQILHELYPLPAKLPT